MPCTWRLELGVQALATEKQWRETWFVHSSLKKERRKEVKKEGNMKQSTSSDFTGAVKGGQVQREKYEKHQRCVCVWVITYYWALEVEWVYLFQGPLSCRIFCTWIKTNGSDYSAACHLFLSLSLSLLLLILWLHLSLASGSAAKLPLWQLLSLTSLRKPIN